MECTYSPFVRRVIVLDLANVISRVLHSVPALIGANRVAYSQFAGRQAMLALEYERADAHLSALAPLVSTSLMLPSMFSVASMFAAAKTFKRRFSKIK